jgi:hypothetical protein
MKAIYALENIPHRQSFQKENKVTRKWKSTTVAEHFEDENSTLRSN